MNRVTTIVLIGFLACLFGCGKSASPPSSEVFMIDYAHESSGAFYHGTFSLVNGRMGATWTIERNGKKQTGDVKMSEATFRDLWDSLNEIEDFKKGAAKDPNQLMDVKTHQVIAIAYRTGGKEGSQTYLIPTDDMSPAFKEWRAKLGYPGK